MSSWDRQDAQRLARAQDVAVRSLLRDWVGPFSPFWRERLAALGLRPSELGSVADLERVTAVGERDVSPTGDAADMARLVLQVDESGYALHAPGPDLRRALWQRVRSRDLYRRTVESDSRPSSFAYTGLGFRFPVASTRNDLDVLARAGARLCAVAGVQPSDSVLVALPNDESTELVALRYALLATGTPALFTGGRPDALTRDLRALRPTVLAVRTDDAADVLAAAGDAAAGVRLLLLVGAPTPAERARALEGLRAAGSAQALVVALHTPSGARVLWAECAEGARDGAATGYHTYPDLDVVQTADPHSGEGTPGEPGELVLTQTGLRGSVLLRWRTGDVVDEPLLRDPCPRCGRTVPRVPAAVRRAALVAAHGAGPAARRVDLRSLAGALAGRADVRDWRVVVGERPRDGVGQVLVYFVPGADPAAVAVGAATDVREVAGALPTQLVAVDDVGEGVPADAVAVTARIVRRPGAPAR